MEVKSVACKSCGAPLDVPQGADQVQCRYCGAVLAVERGEGYVALRTAEEVSKSVRAAGDRTQEAIRESTYATQAELKRLQLSQELSAAQMQLSNVQAEIRALERQKKNRKTKRQLEELRHQERALTQRIKGLQSAMASALGTSAGRAPGMASAAVTTGYGTKDWTTALVLCVFLGIFGVHRFYSGHVLIGILQLLTMGGFAIWWLVDLLQIIAGSYRDSKGQLLQNRKPALASGCLPAVIVFVLVFIVGLAAASSDPDASAGVMFLAAICGAVVFLVAYMRARKKGNQQ